MNVFIIHGSYGNPDENWIPWLKAELEKAGCKVFVPKFPTPENQSLDSWMKVFQEYLVYINQDTVFVGHSLGPAFILRILEKKLRFPSKAAFFIGPFIGRLGNPDLDKINKTFFDTEFDWVSIKKNCKQFHIFCSDNDPYVPLENAAEVAKRLGVNQVLIKGAGHFNKKSGYKKIQFLLEMIKQII